MGPQPAGGTQGLVPLGWCRLGMRNHFTGTYFVPAGTMPEPSHSLSQSSGILRVHTIIISISQIRLKEEKLKCPNQTAGKSEKIGTRPLPSEAIPPAAPAKSASLPSPPAGPSAVRPPGREPHHCQCLVPVTSSK